jgi:hypothetical protein
MTNPNENKGFMSFEIVKRQKKSKLKIALYRVLALADACLKWLKTFHRKLTRFGNFGGFAPKKHGMNLGRNLGWLLTCWSSLVRWDWFGLLGIPSDTPISIAARRMMP